MLQLRRRDDLRQRDGIKVWKVQGSLQCWGTALTVAGAVLALFTLLYSLQDAYLKGLYHTAFSSFLQEVLLRVLVALLTLAYGLGYCSFHQFVLWYIGLNSGIALLLTGYLAYIGELHLWPTRAVLRVRPWRELLNFGAVALLSNISGPVISSTNMSCSQAPSSSRAAGAGSAPAATRPRACSARR